MTKILGTFILFLFATTGFTQAIGTANAMADIVTPISIEFESHLNFANVAVSATIPGTVELVPMAAPPDRNPGGGCTLPVVTGTPPTAAEFTVHGVPNYTYSITLPATHTIENQTTGTATMEVNTFTSSPTPTGTLDGGGLEILYVGATLNVNAAQEPGHYESETPFEVTVNYN